MITQAEMEQLVRNILDGADLSQVTGRAVRVKVMETLGDRAGNDERAIRNSVRDAISAVLASSKESSDKNNPGEKAAQLDNEPQPIRTERGPDHLVVSGGRNAGERIDAMNANPPESHPVTNHAKDGLTNVTSDAVRTAQHVKTREGEPSSTQIAEGEAKMNDISATVPPTKKAEAEDVVKPSRGMAIADLLGDASGHDADDENDIISDQRDEQKRRRPSQKKRRSRPSLEDDDDDDSDNSANDSQELANGNDTHDEIVPDDNRARRGNRQVKRRRATVLTSERDLERLKEIIKQLGLKVPPAKVRRTISVPEKCAGLVQYLTEKGVDVPNPILLNKRDITMHRKRLENEKELAGLDESNIISDRRSRRARGSLLVHKPDDNELPSELSGEELSASSEHEEDSDEYQVSSQESS